MCMCDWGVYIYTSCHCSKLIIYIVTSASEKRLEGVSCALEYQKFRTIVLMFVSEKYKSAYATNI
jgi:hypothetical protein